MRFTPVVRNSHFVSKSLVEFSKDRSIPTSQLEFELLGVTTLLKRKNEEEFAPLDSNNKLTKGDLLEQETTLLQEYKIKILPKEGAKTLFPKAKVTLAVNKLKTKAILTIHKGSVFTKTPSILKDFKQLIWHKKLRVGLYVGVFEASLNTQLKKIFSLIPYDKPLSKEVKFVVALGVEPLKPIDAKLEKLFENKEKNTNNIIDGVEEGEHIATYTKEKFGKDGRGCDGRYITVRAPFKVDEKPTISDSVTLKENDENIKYFAKESGYVVYKDNKLSISKTLQLAKADFKSTANISDEKENKDVEVHIKHQASHSEDAIGSGVHIDVKELNVDGAVGDNVNITTQNLKVDAQTHRGAKMQVAQEANVKLHRGDLTAKDAQVDMLETGKVTAHNSIHIKKMLGGEAIAPTVVVDELLSNCTIIASKKIEIHSLLGEHNKLIINPDAIESYHKDIASLKEQIRLLKREIYEIKNDFEKRYKEHTQQIERIKVFQTRVLKAQKAGKKPMKQDTIRLKMFQKEVQKFQDEKLAIDAKEELLSTLEQKLQHYYEKDMHAKVICHSSYDGHTKVIFVDLQTKEEIMQLPQGNYETITLTRNLDGQKVIKLEG
jgi:hypothetical protein